MLPIFHAAALILLIQTPATLVSKPGDKDPPPCIVLGRVVTAAEGTPLKSARIALLPEHEVRERQVYAGISDRDGRFLIKDIPAGRYRFVATHTGYVDQEYQSHGSDTGAILALRAGKEVKDMLFSLTLAAVITGRDSDEAGDPMTMVKFIALHRPGDSELEEWDQFSSR